jgi:hypothetical protein
MKPQNPLFPGHGGMRLLLLFILSIIQIHYQCHAHYPQPFQFAERLIRDLNLLPSIEQDQTKHVPASIRGDADSNQMPRLVEKRLHLRILGDSGSNASVNELGHHAGYYSLQHTHAAKYS